VEIKVTVEQIRQLGTRVLTANGGGSGMSSKEAEAFLLLHGNQLANKVQKFIAEFVETKLR